MVTAAKPITLDAIGEQADRVKSVVAQVRGAMLAPNSRKKAPTYNTSQLMALTGLDKSQVDYRIRKGDLPTGRLNSTGSRREFTQPEVRHWIRDIRRDELRPEGAEAITIAVGNFKGGVTKTTTALTLAQGLSLRGHRVLVIDCDPQGSLTTLFGLLPDSEVNVDDTVLPLFSGAQSEIGYAIRPTYWDGIDLVAAASLLFSAEFVLPAKQSKDPKFEFWNVLNYGIDPARLDYDVILIDTPPALSYTTINALMASDGIIMPLPPNALDFASSAQFWDLFSDLTTQLVANRGGEKEFAFIDILLSKVDTNDGASTYVREWISAAYTDKVLPVEIPKAAAVSTSSAEFGTVYDSSPANASTRTFKRAYEAYERFVELIEDQTQAFWRRQLGA
ncbi:ParA family protein [Eleftheria terrae]|uniref:ParA family protein n=1 Tax=Eleftheria terrae TaxID=1597781 RepID=UPI00263BBFF8|nr:AAA family ATPase [Eleftheria terrae]WKB55477.1 AAA family ATPase [Eleftheria terrae]